MILFLFNFFFNIFIVNVCCLVIKMFWFLILLVLFILLVLILLVVILFVEIVFGSIIIVLCFEFFWGILLCCKLLCCEFLCLYVFVIKFVNDKKRMGFVKFCKINRKKYVIEICYNCYFFCVNYCFFVLYIVCFIKKYC